jgi:signal transduction histidine kinase
MKIKHNLLYSVGYIIFLLGLSYAVIKYNHLDIKAVATGIFTFVLWIFSIIKAYFPNNYRDFITNGSLWIALIIVSILLIRGAMREIEQGEELSRFNTKLEQKVAEQTKEIRSAYEVERKARIELEALDKNKDQFILVTQHHLRTPLTIIKGYIQSLLITPPQEFSGQTKNILEKVNRGADRLTSLVNDLLDISQMQVGKNILKKEELDLKPMIEEIFTDMSGELDRKKITRTMDIQEIRLQLDPVRIKGAFMNLIDNAVKYCNEGGTITVKGIKATNENKDIYRLSIQDTGIGLTESERDHIFTQYFERGEEAEKLNKTGRGIGLIITKNIVEAHGGKIYAESQGRGKGAKFTTELNIENI